MRSVMHEALFRELLFESEGPRLDFKRQQYAFKNASDAEKSELLKDLLTLANSWRSTPAYIVVGVEEDAGRAGTLLGIAPADHIDDASLQQFVQRKLNRALEFSYRSFAYDGKVFGVFEIPKQPRPFYATRDYGRVRKSEVYFRRGSSCEVASPEDIARMGRDDAAQATKPNLRLAFADVKARRFLEGPLAISTRLAAPHSVADFPTQTAPTSFLDQLTTRRTNSTFWRELADHVRDRWRFAPFGFGLLNDSAQSAEAVRVELRLAAVDGLEVRAESDLPSVPVPEYDMFNVNAFRNLPRVLGAGSLDIEQMDDEWQVSFDLGLVRPKERAWTAEPLYLAFPKSGRWTLRGKVYAGNLAEPVEALLSIDAIVDQRAQITLEELEELWDRCVSRTQSVETDEPDPIAAKSRWISPKVTWRTRVKRRRRMGRVGRGDRSRTRTFAGCAWPVDRVSMPASVGAASASRPG